MTTASAPSSFGCLAMVDKRGRRRNLLAHGEWAEAEGLGGRVVRSYERAAGKPVDLIEPGSLSGPSGPSEESMAREFVALHGQDWRHDHTLGRDLHWTGEGWRQDDRELLFHRLGEHVRAACNGKPSLARAGVVRGVQSFVRANTAIAVDHAVFDADPFLLGVPGGVVDLRTGKKRVATREDYVTRSTSVAPRWSEPKLWNKFLAEATGSDVPLQGYLQMMAGYFLTGSTTAHALFFIFGAGKNGKSVFVNTLSEMMGDYAVTASMDTFIASKSDRHPTDLARLDGARLVTASETEEGRAWAESRIKQLTGGDRIAARFMRKDFFEFRPVFKLMIAGNFQPQLHNVDEAMRRRFHMIPFTQTPRQPDLRLEEKLSAEHGQILAWAIEGARIWHSRGLTRPDAVVDASERYFEEQDLFGHWIAERCIVKPGSVGRSVDLFGSWRNFARQNGEEAGTQKAMAGALRKRGYQAVRVAGGARAWQGIELAQVFGESDG